MPTQKRSAPSQTVSSLKRLEPDASGKGSMFEDAVMLLRLLQCIPRDEWTTIADIEALLAKRAGLRVQRRTLQRYMQTIRAHADVFPIEVDASTKPFLFRWDPKAKGFILPALRAQDALVLRLAEEALRNRLPPAALAGLRALFQDAKRTTVAERAKRERTWLRKVKVLGSSLAFMPPKLGLSVFERATEALFADKVLFIRYRNAKGKPAEAYVKPLGIVQADVRLYLVCQFEDYADFRHMALHRIESARVTGFDFERPADFDLEDYAAHAPFNDAQGPAVRLEILTDDPALAKNLTETPFNRTQTIAEVAPETLESAPQAAALGPCRRITVDIEDSPQLDGWLAMHRASILSTTKTRLKSAEAKVTPEEATDLAAAQPAARQAAPDEKPAADFVPQRFASNPLTPAQRFERSIENDPQNEALLRRALDTLLVEGRRVVHGD